MMKYFAVQAQTSSALYKFLINALPILIPAINPADTSVLDDRCTSNHSRYCRETETSALFDSSGPIDVDQEANVKVACCSCWWSRGRVSIYVGEEESKGFHWTTDVCSVRNASDCEMKEFVTEAMYSGLQGFYNAFTTKRNMHVPYGDVHCVLAHVC